MTHTENSKHPFPLGEPDSADLGARQERQDERRDDCEAEEQRLDNHETRMESMQSGSDVKSEFNGIVLIVVSIILTVAVALLSWTMVTVVELGKQQAKTESKVEATAKAIDDIQQRGSPVIQAVLARLDSLQAGQTRMENALNDHMKLKP